MGRGREMGNDTWEDSESQIARKQIKAVIYEVINI